MRNEEPASQTPAAFLQVTDLRSEICGDAGAGPFAFFFLCCGFWLAGFPWYLWMRYKIKNGTAELKTNDPKCVRREELIVPETSICPKCGWTQPKQDTRNES